MTYETLDRARDTYFEFTPDTRCVLDLPHALREASDADAAAVLLLVADVRDDVLRREVTSEEEGGEINHSSVSAVDLLSGEVRSPVGSRVYVHLMGPEEVDRDSLLVSIFRLTDLNAHRQKSIDHHSTETHVCYLQLVCACVFERVRTLAGQ